jgi:PAS domain S-box-containing protein
MSAIDILLVDNEELMAHELRKQLEQLGYTIAGIARSGEEALAKVRERSPHLVLMNVRLAGNLDAIQAGNIIREQYDIPVIYLLDYNSQATIRRAGATGPFGYIFRPVDSRQIFATIEVAVIRHELERQLEQSRRWLNTTLTSIGDGVIATDQHQRVRFINPAATQQTGWQNSNAIGRSLSEVFPLVDEHTLRPIKLFDVPENGVSDSPARAFIGLLTPGKGPPRPVEVTMTAITDGKGNSYGTVLIFRDITRQRKAMQEISRQANRAEALMRVASQLNSRPELEAVLNTICESTNQIIQASGTAVVLDGPQEGFFRNCALVNRDLPLAVQAGVSFHIPKQVLESLLSRHQPVIIVQDDENHPLLRHFEVLRQLGIKTIVLAGLFRGGHLLGALMPVFTQTPKPLAEDEVALLRGLADQASSAIQNAQLFEQVRAGRERQRKLAKSLVEIQEAERRHIARELHDHLGQLLTGLQFMLESAKHEAAGDQRSRLEEIQAAVSDVIGQVREMSLNLRPGMLDDMGLLPTLHWHIDRYTRQTGIKVNFRCSVLTARFPAEIETAAYRIIQEALTNVARYARVTEVFVGLVEQDKTLWVEVLDKGQGFDPSLDLDRPSSGLEGMRERASLLGGYLTVRTFINQGTQILAALPLTDHPLERRKHDRNHFVG